MTQTDAEHAEQIRDLIRDIPDFPSPGIMFRDITTVLKDATAWRSVVDRMCLAAEGDRADVIVGTEARGFILGAAMAYHLGVGFIPVRKPGKLPADVHAVSYDLEYGSDALEIHKDALGPGHRVLIVDDLLATGGTAAATADLVAECGAQITGLSFLIELLALDGRSALPSEIPVHSLISY